MAFTNIPNANLQVGAPLRSVDILALRDNVSAVPNGDTGAPRIKAAALDGGSSGSAPIFAARAWVNFNGTGAVQIRASGNVSGVTRIGTAQYQVSFATPIQDANYAIVGNPGISGSGNGDVSLTTGLLTTTNVRVVTRNQQLTRLLETDIVSVSIFR